MVLGQVYPSPPGMAHSPLCGFRDHFLGEATTCGYVPWPSCVSYQGDLCVAPIGLKLVASMGWSDGYPKIIIAPLWLAPHDGSSKTFLGNPILTQQCILFKTGSWRVTSPTELQWLGEHECGQLWNHIPSLGIFCTPIANGTSCRHLHVLL